ncbi:MAG: efflux RND transporter permease subunit [Cytophaga sp.]|uniref:efflux RND transporter permease subunit n=1 Tax=Cytophaga sp. TaxID=29535 RepID=UPI003F7FD185
MGKFFVNRPIVAIVISIVMILLGIVALTSLPISQYPEITPPEIQITTTYRGAGAVAVEQAVATPLEQKVNGVEEMLYMKSTNASDGSMTIRVTFEVGTNLDNANMLTQNRVSQGTAFLPVEVKNEGVTTKKSLSFPLVLISLQAEGELYDNYFLSNYASINIVDPISRIKGVGQVNLMGGSEYAMRIWLKPDQIARLGLSVNEVMQAVKEQNTISAGGSIGGAPAAAGVDYSYTVVLQERLMTVEQFENIIVKAKNDGSTIRLKDVARVEFGLENYNNIGRVNSKASAIIAIYQVPGSNALAVADEINAQIEKMQKRFPPGVNAKVTLDTTKPIMEGVDEIVHTLFEAIVLVILVVFIFLQDWRATIIPLMTVPVALLATFLVFPILGFTINILSLLGLVLAIGIVVDDAIVVVEAVIHNMEHGLNPKEATIKAMSEISGPVIAIALILTAVFIPVAFIPGISGSLYQQFAVTIAISVLFSAFNALTLSPALAGLILKPKDPNKKKNILDKFFEKFNKVFDAITSKYVGVVGLLARKAFRSLIITGIIGVLIYVVYKRIPGGFVPGEDQGYYLINIQLPDGSSLERSDVVTKKIEKLLESVEGVQYSTSVVGMSMLSNTNASNYATVFISLHEWAERRHVNDLIKETNFKLLQTIPEATCIAYAPPPIAGLGNSAGFSFMLQDRSGNPPAYLAEQMQAFLAELNKRPEIGRVTSMYQANIPQIKMSVDADKAKKLDVSLDEINKAVGGLLSTLYVNDINRFGKQYKVLLQADMNYRKAEKDLAYFFVKSNKGEMIPLNTLVTLKEEYGPAYTNRFNMFRSAEVTGLPAPNVSSAQAMKAVEEVAEKTLNSNMSMEWTNLSYQEKKAEGKAGVVFAFAILLVFLILAAQYESWTLPFSVLLGVPIAILGAFGGLWMMNLIDSSYVNNIYAQISLIMLIGLAAKNAILIVEYAKMLKEQGKTVIEAAIEAAKLRFRPILMTAFAFILGATPLLTASGAGAEARKVMGLVVFSGMLIASIFGIIIIPALYVVIEKIFNKSN